MDRDLRVVFDSSNRRACADRALVLDAAGIAYQIVSDTTGHALVVPAAESFRAAEEIRLYEAENPGPKPAGAVRINYQNAVPGIVGYLFTIVVVAWLAGTAAFNHDWLSAGRVDGSLIRAGEWWRSVTALTLHSGFKHIAGNILFGALFGLFAGRLLGSGVAWLAIVFAGASGNLLNTLLLESAHRSIGASTAVFAALGIVAGFVWRARLMNQERWSYRLGPIVGGFALLMFTGTGDANTDIGAHLMGFLCGMATGMALTLLRGQLESQRWQIGSAALAVSLIAAAWGIALVP